MLTILIILFSYFVSPGQVVPKNFSGQISYKTDWHSAFITRDSCGDFSDYRTISINNDFFIARDSFLFEQYSPNYLKQKFIATDKALLVVYLNPIKNVLDTSILFSLKINDTINGADDFLIQTDSTSIWDPVSQTWHFKEVAISAARQSEATRLKDETILLLGKKILCYKFEKISSHFRSSHPSETKRIIYIDKLTLLPVGDEEFILYSRKGRCKIPGGKWFLISKTYITRIKNSR